ncbi:MAG TPA: TatD family hydrolase, partial [Minicystis sp.]|nr:TatD family hydrolase [Minicystis sp.]
MTTLVDTHCHLDEKNCPEGADAVIARARAAGVEAFVTVGVGRDLAPAREAVALAERVACVVATVGVHPHDAAGCDDAAFAEIERL